jgi:hypothetical protein
MRALINVNLPKMVDSKGYMTSKELVYILDNIMGLEMIPRPAYDETNAIYKEFCLQKADPLFKQIPSQEKIDNAKKQIIYVAELITTETHIVITRQSNKQCIIRLFNPRTEKLKKGCTELVSLIQDHNKKNIQEKLEIDLDINLFENGLDEYTIRGNIVENRWKYGRKIARKEVILFVVGITIFALLTSLKVLTLFQVLHVVPILDGISDRISTAMLTTAIVSGITIYYTVIDLSPIINWQADRS